MRLFLGIELPALLKNHIALSVAPLQKTMKGWDNPHDYHMTLLFIGDTPDENLPGIIARLRDLTFSPFTLTFRSLDFFPRRVMYLSCDPSSELVSLKNLVEATYPEYVRIESKKFIPHITIKRWQRYEYAELKKGIDLNPFEAKSITVDHLSLFKSERDAENQKYHVLARNRRIE